MVQGVNSTDFSNFPESDWGVTVSREAVTNTSNPITGKTTRNYAAGTNHVGILHIMQKNKYFEDVGEIEAGNAYFMSSTQFHPFDKITHNSKTWLVVTPVIARTLPDGSVMYYFAKLKEDT